MKNKKTELYKIALVSVMTSLICVIAPISIITPFSIVPVSLSTFIIVLSAYILGLVQSLISIILYILIGCCGLPVFSNWTGGVKIILGPTGGYIVGYIFLIIISGFSFENFESFYLKIIGSFIAMLVLYCFGTAWLSFTLKITFVEGLAIGVFPFIIFDILKIFLSIYVGEKCKRVLKANGLL